MTEYLKNLRNDLRNGSYRERVRATFLLGSLPLMAIEYLITRPPDVLPWVVAWWIEWIPEALLLAAVLPSVRHWLRKRSQAGEASGEKEDH